MYWTSALVPGRWGRILSYWVGVFTCAAWFFWTVGTYLLTADLVFGTVTAFMPEFAATLWQVYLLYLGVAAWALLINIPLFKIFPLMLKGWVVVVNIATVFLFVALLARAHPKASAASVFTDFVNETGWSSNGVVFFLGLLPGITAVNGFDSAAHVAEEMPDPARQIPQVMVWYALMSGIPGIPMVMVYLFCIVDATAMLTPIGGQPMFQLMHDAFQSKALLMIGCLIYLGVFYVASASILTTFSRVIWSFAGEKGLPASTLLVTVNEEFSLPVNAVVFATTATALFGLLELGPSTVLNAIIGTAAICFFISYSVPIAAFLAHGRKAAPAKRYFDLGTWGILFNCLALGWMMLMIIWLMIPIYLPVTASNMNYSVAVVSGTVLIFGTNWAFYSRKNYAIPKPLYVDASQDSV